MASRTTIIGITLGDVNGIGPEVACAATARKWPESLRLVLIGDRAIVTQLMADHGFAQPACWAPEQSDVPPSPVSVWDPGQRPPLPHNPGRCRVAAARAAYDWICAGTQAALDGKLHALVTAPIQKEGFMKAGIDVPGHTELLARCCGVQQVEMMLLAGTFRVVLATRHIPLANVPAALTPSGLQATIRMTAEMLEWLGARHKRIAVCGLNPHAGDGGAIGREEQTCIMPAIRQARRQLPHLTGPVPADTVFHQVRQHQYDAVVAMYHDQGLAPFKMWAFDRGVNLTGGLPIVRTSPDHGTAYDLAGRNQANPASMVAAIRLAARLAHRPNPWARA